MHECHRNVTIWCEHRADHKAVRGWLFFDLTDTLQFIRFIAHSVVEDKSGAIFDITPAQKCFSPIRSFAPKRMRILLNPLVEHGITNIDISVV